MARHATVNVRAYSARFLGTTERATALLDLLETLDRGRWVPEKWNDHEPVRYAYSRAIREKVIAAWASSPSSDGSQFGDVLFRRQKPYASMIFSTSRCVEPSPSDAGLDLDAREFRGAGVSPRLRDITRALVVWGECFYASVGTPGFATGGGIGIRPQDGLTGIFWLNFFGRPFIEMFGESRLRSAPWHSVHEIEDHGTPLPSFG